MHHKTSIFVCLWITKCEKKEKIKQQLYLEGKLQISLYMSDNNIIAVIQLETPIEILHLFFHEVHKA